MTGRYDAVIDRGAGVPEEVFCFATRRACHGGTLPIARPAALASEG